jgi:hypothetical protein
MMRSPASTGPPNCAEVAVAGGRSDVIHYQAANRCPDRWCRFVFVMVGERGAPMLTLVDDAELVGRRHRRAPRPS